MLSLATPPGPTRVRVYLLSVTFFSTSQHGGGGNCFLPSSILAFCLTRAGGIELVRSPRSHEKMKPNWNSNCFGHGCSWQCAEWTFHSPFSQVLIGFIFLSPNPGQGLPCILKTQPKNTDHPSSIFQLKFALASSLRIQLPSPGPHFFRAAASSQLLFYYLVSFKITNCSHTINQVLTWFLPVSQSWEQ